MYQNMFIWYYILYRSFKKQEIMRDQPDVEENKFPQVAVVSVYQQNQRISEKKNPII